jgi:glycogen debranching enzyme
VRLQEEYRWGEEFTNNPPSDVVVGRDSMWYLMGSSYYAQLWSSKLLALWFAHGLEASGKFTEYMEASREPLFSDDYGLNINDNTPLLMIAERHYYSLTGDRGAYLALVHSAEFIESQRYAGENNRFGLVWCTSTEKFVRGLFGWRNVIANYNLSGAVTEVNSEAYEALRAVSELAGAAGDPVNEARFRSAAEDLREAMNRYLRPAGNPSALYYLNINPAGHAVEQDTADEVYPVLYGVADTEASLRILDNLFSNRFFVRNPAALAVSGRSVPGRRNFSRARTLRILGCWVAYGPTWACGLHVRRPCISGLT